MLAPSMYTWPPFWWTMSHTSVIVSSKTPCVDGYVIINAESCAGRGGNMWGEKWESR